MDENTKNEIENEIQSNDVVLYMKGTPVFPQCGFSASTVGVLNHLGIKFSTVNVLENAKKVYVHKMTVKLDHNEVFGFLFEKISKAESASDSDSDFGF